jgi:hypothetical protein
MASLPGFTARAAARAVPWVEQVAEKGCEARRVDGTLLAAAFPGGSVSMSHKPAAALQSAGHDARIHFSAAC